MSPVVVTYRVLTIVTAGQVSCSNLVQEEGGYETDSSDGFWSGNLRPRPLFESPGASDMMVYHGVVDSDESLYKDPIIKTFVWWETAMRNDEKDFSEDEKGRLEEIATSSEEEVEGSWTLRGRKGQGRREKVSRDVHGRSGPVSESDRIEALWQQWS